MPISKSERKRGDLERLAHTLAVNWNEGQRNEVVRTIVDGRTRVEAVALALMTHRVLGPNRKASFSRHFQSLAAEE